MTGCNACNDTGYEMVEISPLQADWQLCTAPGCRTAATIRARAERYGGKKMTIVETASRAERQRQFDAKEDGYVDFTGHYRGDRPKTR